MSSDWTQVTCFISCFGKHGKSLIILNNFRLPSLPYSWFWSQIHMFVLLMYAIYMMMSSNGNIFRWPFVRNSPVTLRFDVFLDLRLNKRLSKQPWGWWFETPSRTLWRHRNGHLYIRSSIQPGCRWKLALASWNRLISLKCVSPWKWNRSRNYQLAKM